MESNIEVEPSVAEKRLEELAAETKEIPPENPEQKAAQVEALRSEIAEMAKPEQKPAGQESNESLEAREKMLSNEIAKEINKFEKNIDNIESLAEDEEMTPSLRARVLSSIDTISNKIQTTFMIHLGGTAMFSGVFGLHEYLINTGQSIVEAGSILGDANKVALAGLTVYAVIKGIQFAGHKIEALSVRRGVEEGTVEGASAAAAYLTQKSYVDKNDLDISSKEHDSLFSEHESIFREERAVQYSDVTKGREENYNRWKSAMKRVRNESSRVLAQ